MKLEPYIDIVSINCLVSKCVYCSFSSSNIIYIAIPPNNFTDD